MISLTIKQLEWCSYDDWLWNDKGSLNTKNENIAQHNVNIQGKHLEIDDKTHHKKVYKHSDIVVTSYDVKDTFNRLDIK